MEIESAFTCDTKPLDNSLEHAKKHVQDTVSEINKSGMGVEDMLGKIGKMAGAAFAAFSAQQFISQVVDVRKEFQSLEVSFTTLLGSAEKGKKMFQDITNFATSTPMLEKDLAAGAQTLLGFNIEAEKVLPILKEIGDVSMGDSQKFQSLVLAFSQASSTGKLMGQDLLQMINAGFNPLAEISRTTGKSMSELKDDMSNGKITVEMLEGAFKSATSEGGKFNGMLESMSHTLEGAQSNLEGAIQKLMNDVGKEIEQPIIEGMNDATAAVNYFAENIDSLAAVVKGMVAVFGVYKTACVAVTVANKAAAASEGVYSAATTAAYIKTQLLAKAQAFLNATMLANPYVLAATALTALVATIVVAETSTDAAASAQKTLNSELEKATDEEQKLKDKIDKYIETCNDVTKSTEERQEALQNLYKYYPNIISKYVDEEGHLKNILALQREINAENNKRSQTKTKSQANQMQQYADIMRKVAGSKNGTADLTGKEMEIYNAANEYYRQHAGNMASMGSGAKDKANYFDQLAKGYNAQAQQKQTEQNISKFEERINKMNAADLKRWESVLQKTQAKLKGNIKRVSVKGIGELDASQIKMLLDRVSKQYESKSGANSLDKAYKDAEKRYKEAEEKVNKIQANKAKYSATEYTKAKEELDAAEKEYKKYGGKTDKQTAADDKKAATAANKAANERAKRLKEQEALTELQQKLQKSQSRDEQDAVFAAEQSSIDALQESNEKKLRQINLNYEKEKVAIQRGIEDAKEKAEEEAKALWKAQNPDAEKKGLTWEKNGKGDRTFDLTAAQQKEFDNRTKANEASAALAKKDLNDKYIQSMLDYLKQYGSIEQQRAAITAETEQKIKELREQGASSYELAAAEQDGQAKLENLNFEKIKEDINWEEVFSSLDGYTTDFLESLRDKLRAALDMTDIGAQNAKVLTDQLEKVIEQIESSKSTLKNNLFGEGKVMGGSWIGSIVQNGNKISAAEQKVALAKENYEKAKTDYSQKQEDYDTKRNDYIDKLASARGEKAEDLKALSNDQLMQLGKGMGNGLEGQGAGVLKAQSAMTTAQGTMQSAGASLQGAQGALKGAQGAGGFAIAEAIVKGADANVQSMNKMVQDWNIGSDGFQQSVGKFAEGSSHAVQGFEALKNGDVFGVIYNVAESISDFGEAFGVWSNSNRAEVEKENERLANAMKVNTEALDRLTEAMDEGSATEKYTTYKQAESVMKANEKLAQQTMQNNASMYDHGHSLNYDFNDDNSDTDLMKRISDVVGQKVNSLSDILTLSAEQLNAFYTKEGGADVLTDLTQAILDAQDEGNYNGLADDLLDYINSYNQDAYDELQNTFREAVTGESFDNFKDSFKNALMDMDAEASDFADDFTEKLTQSIIDAQIEKLYGDQLQQLYSDWSEALSNDNDISEEELAKLQKEQDALTERMLATRDKIAEATGYDDVSSSEASGSINAAESISEDTANELVGRMTAIQLGMERENTQVTLAIAQLTTMTASISEGNQTLHDIRDAQQTGNEYLADIVKYTKAMHDDWDDKISTMTDHLKQL